MTWPRQKRNRMLAWGLSLALAVGAAFSPPTKKEFFSSKVPISETLRKKRRISFHLMFHPDRKTALCNFNKSLRESKPDVVFFEASDFNHKVANMIDSRTSDPAMVRDLEDTGEYALSSIIKKSRLHAGQGVRIYSAESYSKGELKELSDLKNNHLSLMELSLYAFLGQSPLENVISLFKVSNRQYGKYLRLRNDRIFNKIARIMEGNGSALLIVGFAHRNLMTLFSNAGYGTAVSFDTKVRFMSSYYEQMARGWSVRKIDEDNTAARKIAVSLLAINLAFGRYGIVVAEQAIPQSFSVNDLRKLRPGLRAAFPSPTSIIEVFVSLGYKVPTTRAQFVETRRRLGFGTCD